MGYGPGFGFGFDNKKGFHPSDITNLVTFQDAQDISSFTFASGSGDGDPVSKWDDTLGSNKSFTRNASSVDTMVYKSIGALGKPALRKNGPKVVFDSDVTTMYTLASGVTQILFFSIQQQAAQQTGMVCGLFKTGSYLAVNSGGVPYYNTGTGTLTLPAWDDTNELLMIAVTASSLSSATLYNGINSTTFDPNDAWDDNGGARIGSLSPTTATTEAEFYGHLIYNRALTAEEIAKIFSWGRRKYGKVSPVRDMFIIAGQSNAEGRRGIGETGVPTGYINVPRIDMLQTDQVLRKGDDPVDANTGAFAGLLDNSGVGFGFGMPFADDLASALPKKVGLVPVARGGTRIAQWARNASDPDDTTTYYGCLLTQAIEAKEYGNLRALIWYQGESDAADGTLQATYEEALTDLIGNLRSDTDMASLPVLVIKLHQWEAAIETNNDATLAEWTAIQDAQTSVAGSVDNCYLVDASDLAGETGDELHLSVASYKTLGARVSTVVKDNLL